MLCVRWSAPGRRRLRGAFDAEIVPVIAGKETIRIDEQPGRAKPEKIPDSQARFRAGRHHHRRQFRLHLRRRRRAGSDARKPGESARQVTRRAHHRPCQPCPGARALHHRAGLRHQKLLARIGWRVSDVDLFEVNEAFAVVALVAMRELDIAAERINIHGGACALGHPIGASGARLLTTLISALKTRGLKRGVASLCIGGGEATAMAIELAD